MIRPASPPKTGDRAAERRADSEPNAQPASVRDGRRRPDWLERVVLPDDLHVRATPRSDPAAKEIAIAPRAIGVNLDVPPIGWELSGVVIRAGGGFQIGDPVMGVTDHGKGRFMGVTDHGACLDEVVAPAARFVKLPAGWSFEQGAAFPLSYLSAFELVSVQGKARRGMRVLVQGATGAVGRAALQIGGALGCELVGLHGRGGEVDLVLDLGRLEESMGVLGVDLDYLFDEPARLRHRFEEILALPGISPAVGALFPVEAVDDAFALLQSGRSLGTLVLAVDPG